MAEKRKRIDLDIRAKIDVLKQRDNYVKRRDIGDKYGIHVSTIAKLIKNREKIEKDFHSPSVKSDCKKMRMSTYGIVDEALFVWLKKTEN